MMDAEGQAEIERLRAVIAAMREAFVNTPKKWDNGYDGYVCAFCECSIGHTCECPTVREGFAQLAADHDAAVRADERRKVLEEVKQMAELWAEQEIDTVTHNAAMGVAEWAERQLTAQPKEDNNG